ALEGKTLGGSFEVKGRYPGAEKKDAAPPAKEELKKDDRGSVRVTGVDLAQLAGAMKLESLRPLRGLVDLSFDFANDLSEGAGRVSVRGLGWGTTNAAQDLSGAIVLRDGVLEVRDFAGSIAQGYLRARGRV